MRSPQLTAPLSARALGDGAAGRIAEVLAADPANHCLVAERFERGGMNAATLGGRFWGVAGGRDALAFVGGNVVAMTGEPVALQHLAHAIGRRARTVASLIGPAAQVLSLWQHLEPRWGPAREVRPNQPLLACLRAPAVAGDPRMLPVEVSFLERYLPAAVAMFTEEVGVDPERGDNGVSYRARVGDLIQRGQAFAVVRDGRVLIKAEIGARSSRAAIIQGVWVHPEHRGRHLAAPAVATLVRHIQQDLGILPCLYVNHHNLPARAAYARIGFQQVGTYASVLF